MSELAVCTLAFGWKYLWRMERLKETLQNTNPDVKVFAWNELLPPGARPFKDSMYGFKPYAVNVARNEGFKKIVWLDATVVVLDKLDYYDQFTSEHGGILAVQDDNKLTGFCSNRALQHIGEGRGYLADKHLVGGSFYYFDFNYPTCENVFNQWIESERQGLFGSVQEECSERLQGHRSDETMMALFLYKAGMKPFNHDTRYNWDEGGVIRKFHFK